MCLVVVPTYIVHARFVQLTNSRYFLIIRFEGPSLVLKVGWKPKYCLLILLYVFGTNRSSQHVFRLIYNFLKWIIRIILAIATNEAIRCKYKHVRTIGRIMKWSFWQHSLTFSTNSNIFGIFRRCSVSIYINGTSFIFGALNV